MLFILHATCSCIPMHRFFPFNIFFNIFWTVLGLFWLSSLFLPLFVYVSLLLWHPNVNLLYPITLFVPGHLLLLIPPPFLFSSVMRRPNRTSLRTFLNEAFIRNAESFCQTFLTLTHCHSQSGLGVTVWCPDHMSIHADPGVLLQHAWIWFFSTSFYHSCLRYTHCCHTGDCLQCAPCS